MKDNKYKTLAKNTLIFTIASFGSKILTFLLVPLYTSVLSTSDYGTADLISTTATLLIYVFTINISDGILRFAINNNKSLDVLTYGRQVLIKGSLLFLCVDLVAAIINPLSWDKYCYAFLFIVFFLNALYQILTNYLKAIGKVKEVAIAGIITTAVTIISNISFLLICNFGLIGYLISLVLGILAACLFCICKIGIRLFLKKNLLNSNEKNEIRNYSIPLIFNGIAWWINHSLDKYFILFFCGTSVNGIYAVASKIPAIMTVFQQIFFQSWNLSAITEFDKEDKDGFFTKTYELYNCALVLSCSGLILMNIPLAKILYAKDFFLAWRTSSILLVSVLFSALSGFVGSIFSATKNSRMYAISTVIAAVVNTGLNIALIPRWGAEGAAIATVISFYVVWVIRHYLSCKYISWKVDNFRNHFAYALIVIQVIIEHLWPSYFYIEIFAFVLICLIYKKNIVKTYQHIRTIVKKRIRKC